jgi:hypothetical protein
MRFGESAVPSMEIKMQQPRKTSFLKSLFGAKRQQSVEPKKAVQPLDERHLARIAGGVGETGSPKGGWN